MPIPNRSQTRRMSPPVAWILARTWSVCGNCGFIPVLYQGNDVSGALSRGTVCWMTNRCVERTWPFLVPVDRARRRVGPGPTQTPLPRPDVADAQPGGGADLPGWDPGQECQHLGAVVAGLANVRVSLNSSPSPNGFFWIPKARPRPPARNTRAPVTNPAVLA